MKHHFKLSLFSNARINLAMDRPPSLPSFHHFLSLPRELRDRICYLALLRPSPPLKTVNALFSPEASIFTGRLPRKDEKDRFRTYALLLVSHQINSEVSAILYSRFIFLYTPLPWPSHVPRWLLIHSPPLTNVRHIGFVLGIWPARRANYRDWR